MCPHPHEPPLREPALAGAALGRKEAPSPAPTGPAGAVGLSMALLVSLNPALHPALRDRVLFYTCARLGGRGTMSCHHDHGVENRNPL